MSHGSNSHKAGDQISRQTLLTIQDIIPPDSWDTHVHVFDPVNHPYIPESPYDPPARSPTDLVNSLPTHNYVIVVSGPEGTNTSQAVEAMASLRAMGRKSRGTVVMDLEQTTVENLQRLNEAGVRSVRFNTRGDGDAVQKLDELWTATVALFQEANVKWMIDGAIWDYKLWHALIPIMRKLHDSHGTIFVADHMFAIRPSDGASKELYDLIQAVDDGVIVVKVSAMYRYGRTPQTMAPIVKRILKARQGRGGIWGSDWPHVVSNPGSRELETVDIPAHLEYLKQICDEVGQGCWEKLMVTNAAALFA